LNLQIKNNDKYSYYHSKGNDEICKVVFTQMTPRQKLYGYAKNLFLKVLM